MLSFSELPADWTVALRFRNDLSVIVQDTGFVQIASVQESVRIGPLPPPLIQLIELLRSRTLNIAVAASPEALGETLQKHGLRMECGLLGQLPRFISQLAMQGALWATFKTGGGAAIEIVPLAFGRMPDTGQTDPLCLRKDSFLRAEGGLMILEAPDGYARIRSNHPILAQVFARFAVADKRDTAAKEPTCAADKIPASDDDAVPALLNILRRTGFLVSATGKTAAQAEDGAHRWEFHDRLFHMRSRAGFHDAMVGPSFRFAESEQPLPLYKPIDGRSFDADIHIPLEPCDALCQAPYPLQKAFSERASRRVFADKPVSVDRLSALLYLSCRVRREHGKGDDAKSYETSNRPSPSGGGCHSLEVYLLVRRCDGLDPGVYHYDPKNHALNGVNAPHRVRQIMLTQTKYLNGSGRLPDVLMVISSRFGRVNWKYQSMSYATVLKDAGALVQTLYLNCEQLRLSGTALGTGNIYHFQQLLGIPITEESSVMEFIVGNRQD